MLQSITPSFGFSVIHIQQSDMYAAVVNTIFWIFSNQYSTVKHNYIYEYLLYLYLLPNATTYVPKVSKRRLLVAKLMMFVYCTLYSVQGWASVLFKRTEQSLHSFTFFIKERNILFGFISHTKIANLAKKKNVKERSVFL